MSAADNSELNRDSGACAELSDLLPAYTIGATTAEETRRVQELLLICPEAADDLQLYADISAGMLETVTPVQPPARLRSNLIAAVAQEEAQAKSPIVSDVPRKTIPLSQWLGWAVAAAAAVLLVVSNLYWLNQFSTMQRENAERELVQTQLTRLISQNNIQRVSLQASDGRTTVATVVWGGESGALVTESLPPLPNDQTYQLWLIGAEGPVSAGIFQTDALGRGFINVESQGGLQGYDAIGISVEPAGGSSAPTTTPLAVGTIT